MLDGFGPIIIMFVPPDPAAPVGGGWVPSTLAVARLVVTPLLFVAVSVKVVVAMTMTRAVVPLTVPTPLSIEIESASATTQSSMTRPPPAGSVAGVAVNDVTNGAPGADPPVPAEPSFFASGVEHAATSSTNPPNAFTAPKHHLGSICVNSVTAP